MADSDFVFEADEPVDVGSPQENDFVYHRDELVSDADTSDFAFIRDRGLGGVSGVIIDDFEDGDIVEYEGRKNLCSVQTGTVYDGTYALEMDTDGDPTRIGSNEGNGLNRYPQRGDVIEYNTWRQDSYTVNMFNVGPSDAEVSTALSDGYICRIGEGDFRIGKRTNGGTTWLTESTYDNNVTGEWLRHEFDFDSAGDGTLVYTLWDSNDNVLESVSANDTEYDGSNLQIRTDGTSARSSVAYWDNIRVVNS